MNQHEPAESIVRTDIGEGLRTVAIVRLVIILGITLLGFGCLVILGVLSWVAILGTGL